MEGFDETLARLRQLEDTSHIDAALDRAAAVVERAAVARLPRDEGELASKMYVDEPGPLRRVVGNSARHAVFTEYSQRLLRGASPDSPRQGPWPYRRGGKLKGTKAKASLPWLRPALRESAERIRQIVRDAVRGSIR